MGDKGSEPKSVKFLFGGLSGMGASLVVHPLDVVKNRMQVSGEGTTKREYKTSFHALGSIARKEGPRALYAGLTASLLRQATYTTTRLGVYTVFIEEFTKEDGEPPSFLAKAAFGVAAGALGAIVGTPPDLALIRMAVDGRLPLAQRRNYHNVFDALRRIVAEEGVVNLWRGCFPTVLRAMVLNAAQLASYSQAKEYFVSRYQLDPDHIGTHAAASMISGFLAAATSCPVDLAKTRIQNTKTGENYSGVMDVWHRCIKGEGFASLWKGFTPYYLRQGPHTLLTFIILEQLSMIYRKNAARNSASA
eukprot:Opistho-2@35863